MGITCFVRLPEWLVGEERWRSIVHRLYSSKAMFTNLPSARNTLLWNSLHILSGWWMQYLKNNNYNHNNGGVACAGGSLVEYQPRLLGSWIPGPRFDTRLGRLRFFPFLPKLHFQFPFPFLLPFIFLSLSLSLRPFVCAKKRILRIYPINHNNNCVSRRCKSEHMWPHKRFRAKH